MLAWSAVCSGLSGAAIWGSVLVGSSMSPPIACVAVTCSVCWKSIVLSSSSSLPSSSESSESESESESESLSFSSRTRFAGKGDREATTVGGSRLCREGCCWERAPGVLCAEISVVVGVFGWRKASRDPWPWLLVDMKPFSEGVIVWRYEPKS